MLDNYLCGMQAMQYVLFVSLLVIKWVVFLFWFYYCAADLWVLALRGLILIARSSHPISAACTDLVY